MSLYALDDDMCGKVVMFFFFFFLSFSTTKGFNLLATAYKKVLIHRVKTMCTIRKFV